MQCRSAITAVVFEPVSLLGCLFFLATVPGRAAENPDLVLRDATFEELANITVTTVSRREENAFRVPAAMHVVTREAVRQSGALTLAEALREVPGLNVAQINADTWAIGARGFQWQYANKLLVMVDGRSVYSPMTGGVRWEDNPVFLEDLDRVEVVRGPGSSVWGANAVNGVINIVTRSAFDTVGTTAFGGTGGQLETLVGARHGIRFSDQVAVRFYGQYQRVEDNILPGGASADDAYRLGFGGARLDWRPGTDDTVTLRVGGHDRRTDYVRTLPTLDDPTYAITVGQPIRSTNRHVAGEWNHAGVDGSNLQLSAYWERVVLDRPQYLEKLVTADVDAVWSAPAQGMHLVTAGLGYRVMDGRFEKRIFSFLVPDVRRELFSGFIQDEITLQPGRLKLSLGTKLEHQDPTGWNLQPTARLAWTPRDDLTLWMSVARAVRTPTVVEQSIQLDAAVFPPGVFDPTLPASLRLLGNPQLGEESLFAWEGGVRWKSRTGWSLDLAGFAYDYRDYVTVTADAVTVQSQPAALILGQRYQNGITGESYGGELTFRWEPHEQWRLGASCNFLRIQLHARGSDPFGFEQDEDTTPRTSLLLTSDWTAGDWRLHLAGRHVGEVSYYGIPAYAALDGRLAWQVSGQVEIALVGRNLLDARHAEYDSALNRRLTELRRTLSLHCQWRY